MPNSPKMLIYKQLQIDILACNSSTRTDICFQKHALMFYATSHGMDELLREIMLINRLLLIFYSRSVKIKKTTVISEKEIIAMENTKIDRRVRKTKALLLKGLTQLMEEKRRQSHLCTGVNRPGRSKQRHLLSSLQRHL